MAGQGPIEDIAYCGLVCVVCSHVREGCAGCRAGGGAENCFQRKCCVEKGIDGCWLCADFPCGHGFFADDAWKGLCIGCIEVIREDGIDTFAELVRTRLGETIDYGEYRFKTPEETRSKLGEQ